MNSTSKWGLSLQVSNTSNFFEELFLFKPEQRKGNYIVIPPNFDYQRIFISKFISSLRAACISATMVFQKVQPPPISV
jgi:hypothetical protein